MFDLPLKQAVQKTVRNHHYFVFHLAPRTHKNQKDRPAKYADPKLLKVYMGEGSNQKAQLLPEVHLAAGRLLTAMHDYGEKINDWSLRSTVIKVGYRPDDESAGANYLRIIKAIIKARSDIFGALQFPTALENEARGILGRPGDPRRNAFHAHVAAAPGWNAKLSSSLFKLVDNVYAPRGSNPHTTGLVFDVDFWFFDGVNERDLTFRARYNQAALTSAAGRWLNEYSAQFGFDSYDTGKEIWHQEFRNSASTAASPDPGGAMTPGGCCRPEELDLLEEQTICDMVKDLPIF